MANQNLAASVQSPQDVVNISLRRIGYKRRVNSLYDGSEAAKIVLDVYAQTRDATLREYPWGFAEKIVTAAANGVPPAIWSYSYAYPDDCIQLRNVIASSYPNDRNNPLPVEYSVGQNSNGVKVIWSNALSPFLVYTRRVTDMTQWDALFVEAVCGALGRRLVAALGQKELAKLSTEDERGEFEVASSVLG